MDKQNLYQEASLKTADNLRSIAQSQMLRDLSSLSLPEIDATVDLVSRVVPAGNVPGAILSGLARLSDRKPPANIVKRDVNLLFKGVERALGSAVSTFFAGPAAVIWGYQNLLKLAGKDTENAFPDGIWQFYVDYALREDTARHTLETSGFDTLLKEHQLHLGHIDRMTAWVMAAIHCLHQYNLLLENEWRERVYTDHLGELTGLEPDAARLARLYYEWAGQRPYERGSDAEATDSYPIYRRRKFDHFLAETWRDLPDSLRLEWTKRIQAAEAEALPAYQQQLSILAYLEPNAQGETRTPIPLKQAYVGLIYQGRYYLIPACATGIEKPADVATVRALVATLMAYPAQTRLVSLTPFVNLKRTAWSSLRQQLNQDLVKELNTLRLAPILLNWDQRPPTLPLAELRQAERGVGDHALTIFDTGETFIFDQSHIFFDAAWGAALAEIMTNEALAWAVYLHSLPPVQPRQTRPYALTFQLKPPELNSIQQAPLVTPEVTAETEGINVKAMLALRKLFKRRNDLIELTVSDLLILYRAIHAVTYRPTPELETHLQKLSQSPSTQQAALATLEAIRPTTPRSPALVIPLDASQRAPRDRLYPLTFEVPLEELDLLNLHQQVMAALQGYQSGSGDRTALYARFDQLQRTYLATLAGFGQVMSRAKEIVLMGESASMATIKLLGHMPPALQRMLEQVSNRFDVFNDLIRGQEIFSDLDAMSANSTLVRFVSAKDDNDKLRLVWSHMTQVQGVMHLTLRDFRPHVGLLGAVGHKDLAIRLAQHYLDTYANGLNTFIRDLRQITETSRETRLAKMEKNDA